VAPAVTQDGVAVAQKDLDRLLAVRRWLRESEARVVELPGPNATLEEQQLARQSALTEAWQTLAAWPTGRAPASA